MSTFSRPQREGVYRLIPDIDGLSFGVEAIHGQLIANVTGAGKRNQANAKLFAADPGMYEALKTLVDRIDNDLLPEGDFPGVPSAIAIAKNALARAEGRE